MSSDTVLLACYRPTLDPSWCPSIHTSGCPSMRRRWCASTLERALRPWGTHPLPSPPPCRLADQNQVPHRTSLPRPRPATTTCVTGIATSLSSSGARLLIHECRCLLRRGPASLWCWPFASLSSRLVSRISRAVASPVPARRKPPSSFCNSWPLARPSTLLWSRRSWSPGTSADLLGTAAH